MSRSIHIVRSFIFVCTDKTQDECFERLLFGTSRPYGAVAMKVQKGDLLFLQNFDSDFLYGVFRASSDGKGDIEPKAWRGRYPYQVRVEPVGEVFPLEDARNLLSKLGIGRSNVISGIENMSILDLYRPSSLSKNEWLQRLSEKSQTCFPQISKNPRSWKSDEIRKIKRETVEEIPQLEATTLWDFPRQSYGRTPKGDNKYPGVTPAELIWNLVWRYTEPGDLVVDPMCGSGTTIDVCRDEKRSVIGFDISPYRKDIIQCDARKIPLQNASARTYVDLVFVDSPYGDNIRYNEHPGCIGKISSETEAFYDELEKVIKECHRILGPGKVLGWLIGNQWVKKKFTPVGFKLYQRLCKHFETLDIVCVTRRGQSSHTNLWYNRARRFNFFLRGFKYLFIMRKASPKERKTKKPRKVTWTNYDRKKQKR